jgi:hypothetical protein
MPFFEDTGIRTENQRGPFLGAFAVFLDQIERMALINVGWAANQLPMIAAFAFPELPIGLRVIFWAYSGAVIFPATGVLFHLMRRACEGELLRLDLVWEALRELAWPSWRTLLPLYSAFIWLVILAWWAASLPALLIVDVLARLAILLLAAFAIYWGPIFAADPRLSALAVLQRSVRLAWQRPWPTLWMGLVVLIFWGLGILSIGGIFLAVPVLTACLQTQLFRSFSQTSNKIHPTTGKRRP